jgi:hypothetical protein
MLSRSVFGSTYDLVGSDTRPEEQPSSPPAAIARRDFIHKAFCSVFDRPEAGGVQPHQSVGANLLYPCRIRKRGDSV